MPLDPTALQVVDEAHETPLKRLLSEPAGLGVLAIVQVRPFQRSARVEVAELSSEPVKPVAVQAVAEWHETALNLSFLVPARRGASWTAQVLPFQCSASSWVDTSLGPLGGLKKPTAMQLLAEVHETPVKVLEALGPGLYGLGASWTAQVRPFQCSTSRATG